MKERVYRIHAGIPHRIALLADLHNSDPGNTLEILRHRRPSLIAAAGDLFIGYRAQKGENLLDRQDRILPFIRACTALAPTYISLGNHEWAASSSDLKTLETTGAVILDNAWVRDGSTGITVGGLTSALLMDYRRFREKNGEERRYPEEKRHTSAYVLRPDIKWLRSFEQQEGYKILLCHHPEYWCLQAPMLRDHPIDLVLSGHAHGGQIRLFGRGLFSPGQGLLPFYTGGIYSGPYGKMIVSRGMANTAPPPIPRLFNPREIVIIDLR